MESFWDSEHMKVLSGYHAWRRYIKVFSKRPPSSTIYNSSKNPTPETPGKLFLWKRPEAWWVVRGLLESLVQQQSSSDSRDRKWPSVTNSGIQILDARAGTRPAKEMQQSPTQIPFRLNFYIMIKLKEIITRNKFWLLNVSFAGIYLDTHKVTCWERPSSFPLNPKPQPYYFNAFLHLIDSNWEKLKEASSS